MEKISSIKLLQKFLLAFFASIIINVVPTIVQAIVPFTFPPAISFLVGLLTFGTYILLWISYAKSKELSTRKNYLLLAILITVFTVLIIGGVFVAGSVISSNAIKAGLIAYTMTQEQMTAVLLSLPEYQLITIVSLGITLVSNIIYLGLGYFIFTKNKIELATAEEEYQRNYME